MADCHCVSAGSIEKFRYRGYYTYMTKIEDAASLFKKGFNCAQSLLAVYGNDLGVDNETAFRLASAFGGGIGCTGQTCGAVAGAIMIIGLKYGETDVEDKKSKTKTYKLAGQFMEQFKARNASVVCRDLLGFDISINNNTNPDSGEILFKQCPKYVKDAAEIIEEIL